MSEQFADLEEQVKGKDIKPLSPTLVDELVAEKYGFVPIYGGGGSSRQRRQPRRQPRQRGRKRKKWGR